MIPPSATPALLRAALLSLLTAGLPLAAQSTAGLQLRVLDAEGRPLPDLDLRIESLDRAEQRHLRTDSQGRAAASGFIPGTYCVRAASGSLTLRLRADERAQATLRLGPAEALVSVEASPLRAETSSVSIQTALLAEEIQRLPFAPHRYVEQALLAPGIGPSGKPEPVVLGSMLDANLYLVDGVPTNLPSTGRFGLNLSGEVLDSQVITTGGHKAEVGFAPGGAFSLVTRSGTNTFQGALFGSRIWRGLNARPDGTKVNTPDERATDATEWGFSVGGPLLRDRLLFFVCFDRQIHSLDFENVAPFGAQPHRRSQGEDRSYRFAKLTWIASPSHRVEFSYIGDPVRQTSFDTAGDSTLKDTQMRDRTRGGDSYLLKHVGLLGACATWENTLGLHRSRFVFTPQTFDAGPFREQLDAPGRESFGRAAEERAESIRNLILRSTWTLQLGRHLAKAGFQGQRSDYTLAYRRPSGGESYLDRAAGGAGPAEGLLLQIRQGLTRLHGTDFGYGSADSLTTPSPVDGLLVDGRASYLFQRTLAECTAYGQPLTQVFLGLFLQDDWQVDGHWQLNLGLRLDRVRLDGEDGRRLYAQTLISPRLGLSWDPAADGSTRVFLYAGRIYSPPAPGSLTAAGATTGGPPTEQQVWIPSLGAWRTWQATGVQGVRNVAVADLSAPRTDLYQLGTERLQTLPGLGAWALHGVLTRKRVRNLIDTYDPAWGYLPDLEALANAALGKKVVANLSGLRRDFWGIDLSAHRQFEGGHHLQLSYSQGDLRGNSEVGNVASSSGKGTGFAQIPSLREDYRQARYEGPLNESVKHTYKAFGAARLPGDLELSGTFVHRSGLRYSPLLLSSKENVLAPGAHRGERELPPASSLDLSLAHVRRVGKAYVRLAVDVFNLLNQQPMTVVNNVGGAFTPGNHQQPRVWQATFRVSF